MSQNLHRALLRPAVIQILRAVGFTNARQSVIDTVTDLASRYLLLLAASTAENASNNHGDNVPTIQDVRMAMTQTGGLRPQMTGPQEDAQGWERIGEEWVPFEDLRGVEAFLKWVQGAGNSEIRRIAGLVSSEKDGADIVLTEDNEDYLTGLRKKHSKTGEESRFQGSVLGKESEESAMVIVGGPVSSIADWSQLIKIKFKPSLASSAVTPATSGISSAPDTPMEAEVEAEVETEVGDGERQMEEAE